MEASKIAETNTLVYDKAFEIYDSFVRVSPLHLEDKRHVSSRRQALNCIDIIIEEYKSIRAIEEEYNKSIGYLPMDSAPNKLEFYEKVKSALEKF